MVLGGRGNSGPRVPSRVSTVPGHVPASVTPRPRNMAEAIVEDIRTVQRGVHRVTIAMV
ncbi:hypothetical protein DPMN_003875 [Dreissena polymorpha]|uniref:Uncharacterized protein n=1 Tax=Dreissena polymorpha TaxID=45954 RepID=A0A9D4MQ67_DREPO|nr:hypothetical protein DPMN_003875 [Dreissena polymorpha]